MHVWAFPSGYSFPSFLHNSGGGCRHKFLSNDTTRSGILSHDFGLESVVSVSQLLGTRMGIGRWTCLWRLTELYPWSAPCSSCFWFEDFFETKSWRFVSINFVCITCIWAVLFFGAWSLHQLCFCTTFLPAGWHRILQCIFRSSFLLHLAWRIAHANVIFLLLSSWWRCQIPDHPKQCNTFMSIGVQCPSWVFLYPSAVLPHFWPNFIKPGCSLNRCQSFSCSYLSVRWRFIQNWEARESNPESQLRRSWSTSLSNFGAPGQPSPATSALPVNFRQQLRRARSTFASNFARTLWSAVSVERRNSSDKSILSLGGMRRL